jgi:hypothetical protein
MVSFMILAKDRTAPLPTGQKAEGFRPAVVVVRNFQLLLE